MTRLRQQLRLPWIALAAIVGMLSAVGESSACEVKSAPEANRPCCANQASSDCVRCCDFMKVKGSTRPETLGQTIITATEIGLADARRRCECHPKR